MANFLGDLGKGVTSAVSLIGGGRGKVDAIALSAKAAQIEGKLRTDILGKLRGFGEKMGAQYGGDYFSAIAEGAQKGSGKAVEAAQAHYFGVTSQQAATYGTAALGAILLGVLLWKKG